MAYVIIRVSKDNHYDYAPSSVSLTTSRLGDSTKVTNTTTFTDSIHEKEYDTTSSSVHNFGYENKNLTSISEISLDVSEDYNDRNVTNTSKHGNLTEDYSAIDHSQHT